MEKGQACKQRHSTHYSDVMFSREGALYGNCSVKITAEGAQGCKTCRGYFSFPKPCSYSCFTIVLAAAWTDWLQQNHRAQVQLLKWWWSKPYFSCVAAWACLLHKLRLQQKKKTASISLWVGLSRSAVQWNLETDKQHKGGLTKPASDSWVSFNRGLDPLINTDAERLTSL